METRFSFLNGVTGNRNPFPFPNTKHWKQKHIFVSKNKTSIKTAQSILGNRNMFPFLVGMLWRREVDWLRMSHLP
jgi:hypothetical protein